VHVAAERVTEGVEEVPRLLLMQIRTGNDRGLAEDPGAISRPHGG